MIYKKFEFFFNIKQLLVKRNLLGMIYIIENYSR